MLTQEEIDGCRDAFLAFDKDRSGTIDQWELRQVLEAMGQKPTDEELFQMISEVARNTPLTPQHFLRNELCSPAASGSLIMLFAYFFCFVCHRTTTAAGPSTSASS